MRISLVLALAAGTVAMGCGSSSPQPGGGAGDSTGGTRGSTGGKTGSTGGTTGSTGTGGTHVDVDAGSIGSAGNPNGSCSGGVPSRGQAADTSNSTVVGDGTAGSCTFAALQSAVAKAGAITFNCGGPATITVTSTLELSLTKNTVIDGGGMVTLDGGGAVRILDFNSQNWLATNTLVTLQHIALSNGKATPTEAIPTAPAPCSQGWNDGQGGALYMRDGNLVVVDAVFSNNQAAPLGPDTGGGAIHIEGSKNGAIIVGSTFVGNTGSVGGAIYALTAELDIYNSLFMDNTATGHDANGQDQSMCKVMNNDQYETGSGGNGGALDADGDGFNIILCGDAITGNTAGTNAFGSALCFTSDDFSGTLSIVDSTVTGNTGGGSWASVSTGSAPDLGSAFGVNAKSITLTNSTLQK